MLDILRQNFSVFYLRAAKLSEVDLGDARGHEWRSQVLVRGQERGKLGQRLNTVVECLKVRIGREKSRVLSQGVHSLDLLPKDEVDEGKLIASQELLLAEEV